MKSTIMFIFTALGLLLLNQSIQSEENNLPEFITKDLDSYINTSITEWQVPGLAISIVKDGQVIYEKGFGKKKFNADALIDTDTLFTLGSTTKAFTATAMSILAHEKNISLDSPIKEHLATFKLSDTWVSSHITLQDMLSHRTGMNTYQGDFIFFDSTLSKQQMLKKLGQIELKKEFRSYGYTNVGYFVIGEVIEKLSGLSWSKYLTDTILKPLQMHNTTINPLDFNNSKNKASAHTLDDGQIVFRKVGDMKNMVAAAGISSSAKELSNWMIAQLSNGKLNKKAVLHEESIKRTKIPKVLIGSSEPPYTIFNKSNFQNYSSGWYHLDYAGYEIITHNGGTYGYSSSITLIPEKNIGITILTNSDKHLLFETIKLEILDAFLQLPYRNYSEMAQYFFKPQLAQQAANFKEQMVLVKNAGDSKIPLSLFKGEYQNSAYGKINIVGSGNLLKMGFQHHPELSCDLKLIKQDTFLCEFNQKIYGYTQIPFTVNNGRIEGMTFSVDANVEPNSYYFSKVQ